MKNIKKYILTLAAIFAFAGTRADDLKAVSEATTWDFSQLTANTESALYSNQGIRLTTESTPDKDTEFVYATYNGIEYTVGSTFKADVIAFKGEYPIRKNAFAQAGTLHFKTSIAGKIVVKFSDVGTSASPTAAKRYLVVNGEQTDYWTSRANNGLEPYDAQLDVTTDEIDVPAGDITITGSSAIQIYKIVFTPNEAPIEVTINEAKDEATFTMPDYDVTASYTLKRDLTVDVTAELASRIRIAKLGPTYMPVNDTEWLPVVTDNLDGDNPVEMINDTDYIRELEKQGTTSDEWSYAGSFSVGTYRWKITGTGNYTGTIYSNEFQLFEGYEVSIPAGEYVTYYKDEALKVEDDDAQLYTITAVNGDKATATELTTAAANTPLLVKNNAQETKTFLLIPTTEQTPDDVTAYSGFKGTLEAAQIAASTSTQNNYALNGKEFVWVKDAIAIAANKAWLEVPASTPSSARAIRIVFGDGDTTGITNTNFTNSTNGNWYDLTGRKSDRKPTRKGVYIMNGKKVVIK